MIKKHLIYYISIINFHSDNTVKYFFLCTVANPDIIIPDSSVSLSTKQQWLQELCYKFVGNYVFNSNDIRGLVDKTADLELKSKPPYQCRVQHCDKTYQFHSVRVRFVNLHAMY